LPAKTASAQQAMTAHHGAELAVVLAAVPGGATAAAALAAAAAAAAAADVGNCWLLAHTGLSYAFPLASGGLIIVWSTGYGGM